MFLIQAFWISLTERLVGQTSKRRNVAVDLLSRQSRRQMLYLQIIMAMN